MLEEQEAFGTRRQRQWQKAVDRRNTVPPRELIRGFTPVSNVHNDVLDARKKRGKSEGLAMGEFAGAAGG